MISSRSKLTVGVFGGSFDPVHFGHLRAALELAFTFDLSEVRLIPNGQPPHKNRARASTEQRQEMLSLAIGGTQRLRMDLREMNRTGLSYTFDTLSELRQELGLEAAIIFGMGADAFNDIASWYRAEELLDLAHIAVLTRPGTELSRENLTLPFAANWAENTAELTSNAKGLLYRLEMTPLSISSTRIREQIGRGWSPRFLLPEPVCEYIIKHKLYQEA